MDLSTLLLARTATAADRRPVMDLLRSNRRIAQRSDKRIGTRIDSVEDDLSRARARQEDGEGCQCNKDG